MPKINPTVYFNEIEPYACRWLKNLYPKATVDGRSITDLNELDGKFDRRHFFGGIGGWEYALHLAGWGMREVWTGSAPCQPFSVCGSGKGENDKRHLWPEFYRLIVKYHPPTIFGEQVAGKRGLEWMSGVRVDLEKAGYAVGVANLCAPGVSAPHNRSRLFWVANSTGAARDRPLVWKDKGAYRGIVGKGYWHEYEEWECHDGKTRRTGPGILPVAHGVPNRMGRLRGYGNAIVAPLAALFIRSFLEAEAMTQSS